MISQAEHILVVEDNTDLQFGLRMALEAEGYGVGVASTLAEGMGRARSDRPDLILLDLMLPDGDGMDLLRSIKRVHVDSVVVVLSAKGSEADRVTAFKLGADDYIIKPFSLAELLQRVRLRLRTRARSNAQVLIGNTRVDFDTQTIVHGRRRMALTRQEARLLKVLLRHSGAPVSRSQLLQDAWAYPEGVRTRTLDYFVTCLRRKIEEVPASPRHLITVRGIGYQLVL
jgi:DNA-binding response OmpR family regulator